MLWVNWNLNQRSPESKRRDAYDRRFKLTTKIVREGIIFDKVIISFYKMDSFFPYEFLKNSITMLA